MDLLVLALLVAVLLYGSFWMGRRINHSREEARLAFIRRHAVPDGVLRRFRQQRPGLSEEQEAQVRAALTQWFLVCAQAGGRFASMPSQVVDDLWHTYILFTRNYLEFCERAFGRYLHHTPVEAMASPTVATAGIRRTWRFCCEQEGIDPKAPGRLPLLFAIDARLAIPDGFHYTLYCGRQSNKYCASHIGCSGSVASCGGGGGCGGGFDADSDGHHHGAGSGDSGGHHGAGGDIGGGDGGGGCGSGCGGGCGS